MIIEEELNKEMSMVNKDNSSLSNMKIENLSTFKNTCLKVKSQAKIIFNNHKMKASRVAEVEMNILEEVMLDQEVDNVVVEVVKEEEVIVMIIKETMTKEIIITHRIILWKVMI